MTLEQLRVGQSDSTAVRLQDGLEIVKGGWFKECTVEKVVVPGSVRSIEPYAFYQCKKLREVIFEPDSCLKSIGDFCFYGCGFAEVVIPKSVL